MGNCETRGERVEALTGVSSSLKKKQEVQTDPPTPPVKIERELSKMTVTTQTGSELAGTEERGRSVVEAGMGDIKGEVGVIPEGWGNDMDRGPMDRKMGGVDP